jgi:hypothetical protein
VLLHRRQRANQLPETAAVDRGDVGQVQHDVLPPLLNERIHLVVQPLRRLAEHQLSIEIDESDVSGRALRYLHGRGL